MELTEANVIEVLSELAPYIEADGGFLEFVEIEHETNFVKVRLGGACSTCAMSAMTLKQGIESKLLNDIPDLNNPTSENLCKWIWNNLVNKIEGLSKIVLSEDHGTGIIYSGE